MPYKINYVLNQNLSIRCISRYCYQGEGGIKIAFVFFFNINGLYTGGCCMSEGVDHKTGKKKFLVHIND